MGQLGLFGMAEANPAGAKFVGNTIYETAGRAREYRELACNLYTGCDHRCSYCYARDIIKYAPDIIKKDRKAFGSGYPREGILEKVRKEARRYGADGEQRQVMFSFTSDCYQKANEEHGLTGKAIDICHDNGLNVCILTKGGSRALVDLEKFGEQDAFASTLTFLDNERSLRWEPGAAMPGDRMATLQAFHSRGIPTWVSLEPVIDPAETLEIIRQTHCYVDEYKVGVLNYHPAGNRIDWRKFAGDVVSLLEGLGCRYYLKTDLRAYLRP